MIVFVVGDEVIKAYATIEEFLDDLNKGEIEIRVHD